MSIESNDGEEGGGVGGAEMKRIINEMICDDVWTILLSSSVYVASSGFMKDYFPDF